MSSTFGSNDSIDKTNVNFNETIDSSVNRPAGYQRLEYRYNAFDAGNIDE